MTDTSYSLQLPQNIEITIDVCKHKNLKDYYEKDTSYPTHYECLDCGSKFPIIGDTDLWKEGVKITHFKIGPVND